MRDEREDQRPQFATGGPVATVRPAGIERDPASVLPSRWLLALTPCQQLCSSPRRCVIAGRCMEARR
jgi:hypothetical protein